MWWVSAVLADRGLRRGSCAAGLGDVPLLEHEDGRRLADDEAVVLGVERRRCAEVDIAVMLRKPAMAVGVIAASVPPVTTASHRPLAISRAALPMAWVPAAHAVTWSRTGLASRTASRRRRRRRWPSSSARGTATPVARLSSGASRSAPRGVEPADPRADDARARWVAGLTACVGEATGGGECDLLEAVGALRPPSGCRSTSRDRSPRRRSSIGGSGEQTAPDTHRGRCRRREDAEAGDGHAALWPPGASLRASTRRDRTLGRPW